MKYRQRDVFGSKHSYLIQEPLYLHPLSQFKDKVNPKPNGTHLRSGCQLLSKHEPDGMLIFPQYVQGKQGLYHTRVLGTPCWKQQKVASILFIRKYFSFRPLWFHAPNLELGGSGVTGP